MEAEFPNVKFAVIQADVGQKAACEKLVAETISQLGGLDIILSNAGISNICWLTAGWTKFCPFEDLDFPEEAWVYSFDRLDVQDKCFAINIKAHVWLLRAALPTFKENTDGGHMIITGSIAVNCPWTLCLSPGTRRWRKFNGCTV